ncbi:beta-aspartyl-peptidase (threonine type) [Mariniphaga anaerophila]|uniref:Isoaspartyl peptidase n=1 Tax=Mariniphaga anaerophila TaxID=1484053 RepID=A0A1M5EVD6_9BACT|nr:isoaspartyl peptidase/L-asparaginase [Mariniphaga anaerophila]SHF83184.1 beta-aspartyl-peptidase (threonine type) [Mariniphaga anaerophila]
MTFKAFLGTLIILFFSNLTFTQEKYAIVIHGGAGGRSKTTMSIEQQNNYKAKLEEALAAGEKLLKNGASSAEAVVEAIKIMEDSPLFNAGKGAVFTSDGKNELDASIMNGENLNAGAVAGVRTIKNPITAAREVMENSEHVMLSGKGASEFARQQGLETVKNKYFFTRKRYESLKALQKKQRKRTSADNTGTVGCVALDIHGNLCAGTSTGGMNNKKYGRIGDSPIIGAGTYANNKTCAVSCTGHGEYYIRLGFARDISALMEYKKLGVKEACAAEIQKLTQLGGTGGVIALDANGNMAMEFNTSAMFRGYIKSTGEKEIAIFAEE